MDRVGLEPTRSCGTCVSGCCREFAEIVLTLDDMMALGDHLAAVPDVITILPTDPKRLPKEVAVLRVDAQHGCAFLRADGCSVYELRPQACRRYDVEHCEGVYVRDPLKDGGKVHLRVR